MKVISTCEREFVIKCIATNSRLDGRSLSEGRSMEIIFGEEWGCCLVALGSTQILAQVSAEVVEPKSGSPTEGALYINVEISAMSSPDIQYQSRMSDENVKLQRILERCIRDSKCIDLESLCIVAGSKVWTIRVDIHALNNDGNLVECASLAAISALAHFKRPDVTVIGTEVSIYSLEEREPVALNLHHMPICINLALFADRIVTDPSNVEERIADGCYVVCVNAHQEICLIHRIGALLLSSDTIQKCEDVGLKRSQALTQEIRKALDDDAYKRATKAAIGFLNRIQSSTILGTRLPVMKTNLSDIIKETEKDVTVTATLSSAIPPKTYPPAVSKAGLKAKKILQETELSVFEGGASKWTNIDDDDDSTDDEIFLADNAATPLVKERELSSEDEAVSVSVDHLDIKPTATNTRTWYSKDPFR
ncbi:exosome complex component RRP45 [Parasteatoda tepidariorum]|uniref:exosome complex component RRP45 n=1 Tax=Parasteatoda tepidariorum TaxID=114398 RepID=UPI00077FC64C|nr:exosome complex component RRP45 [Parasteatoda tepidariorum]